MAHGTFTGAPSAHYAEPALSDSTISVTAERVVFDGPLGKLQTHSHGVLALLLGVERPFVLQTASASTPCAFAVVPAAVEHGLDFRGGRAIVVYVEPHDPSYASFHRAAAGACPTLPKLSAPWRRAVAAWTSRQDCRPLLSCAREVMAAPAVVLDPRVRKVAGRFNRGELLNAPVSELAKQVRLSPSRLVHLVTAELGVGLRRMKQHYRFKLVALAAARGQNLTTAAHAAGFADSGHFSRTFLETFGLSPSKVLLRTSKNGTTASVPASTRTK